MAVMTAPQSTKCGSRSRAGQGTPGPNARNMRTAYQAYLTKAIREANKEYAAAAAELPVKAKNPKPNTTCPPKEDKPVEINVSGRVVTSLENLVIGKQVGQGAYAIVRVAFDKTLDCKVALKIYDKSKLAEPQRQKSVQREIRIMEKLNHPNIVKLYSAFDTRRHVVLSMEYVKGISLHGYVKAQANRWLDETEARRVFRQVVSGIEYCHERCVAHRDIKLENLLLDEQHDVRIIDFGFSTCIPNTKKIRIFCGTPSYMSPEIVTRKEYAGPPADVWALGVLLYAMLCGAFPFKGSSDKELYRRITRGQFVLPDHLSPMSKALIVRILNVDADSRPTAKDIVEDPWLQMNAEPIRQPSSRLTQGARSAIRARPINAEAHAAYHGEESDRLCSNNRRRRDALDSSAAAGNLEFTQILNNASSGATVNNSFHIVNNITHITCPPAAAAVPNEGSAQDSVAGRSNTSSLFSKSNNPSARSKAGESVDHDLVTSIVRLGYPLEEVQRQLQDGSSHIHILYTRLLKQKRNMNVGVPPQMGSLEGSQRLRCAKSRAEGYIRIDGAEPGKETSGCAYEDMSGDVLNNTAPFVFGGNRPAATPTGGRIQAIFRPMFK